MDIAALSIVLNQGKAQQQVGISVLKMAMGVTSDNGNSVIDMVKDMAMAKESSVRPYLGSNVDIRA